MKRLFMLLILLGYSFHGSICTSKQTSKPKYAIRAGKILTMAPQSEDNKTPRVINHGIILVSDGKIEAIGPKDKITISDDYTVIDASDYWIMPGIVEAHSHNGANMRDLNDMVMQVNPELCSSDCVWPEEFGFQKAIEGGVTTLHSMPGSGTNHAGFTVILKTGGCDFDEMILRQLGAMKATQAFNPERRGGDLGRTRMGMSWLLRRLLDKAKTYNDSWIAYEQGETKQKPEYKPEWENLRQVFRKEIPVIVHTYDGWGVIQTARMFGAEYDLNTIATHTAYGGHIVAEDVAKYDNVSINIGPRLLDFYRSPGMRQSARSKQFHGMAARYADGGVKNISINTDAVGWRHGMAPQQELFFQATISARLGLDEMAALEAITIKPAQALQIDHRVGSLETGKDADIVIKTSSLLDPATPVDFVLVNGKIAYQRKGVDLLRKPDSK